MYVIVTSTYNVHPYFSLKNLGKNCALYMAKYNKLKKIENVSRIFNHNGMKLEINYKKKMKTHKHMEAK